jgi:AraC-like DNA-binding protein
MMSDKSPLQWIVEYEMEEIRSYLKNTDLSCKEISDLMGFPNSSFFGRYVKDHTGMTPLEYRLTMRK